MITVRAVCELTEITPEYSYYPASDDAVVINKQKLVTPVECHMSRLSSPTVYGHDGTFINALFY